jgi:uncharacterized protein DUF5995
MQEMWLRLLLLSASHSAARIDASHKLSPNRVQILKGLEMTTQVDQQLLQIVEGVAPDTINDVVNIMQKIDAVLPNDDGLKWFNFLYLMVTNEVERNPPIGGWLDAIWLHKLDVDFARLYFSAITNFIASLAGTPISWQVLFEARHTAGLDRIQFALAGMNAHINHDLSLALLQADNELNVIPTTASPQHTDFESVNGLLETILPQALKTLATGVLGEVAQDSGKIGRLLAFWNVRAARDLAWTFADHLRGLNDAARDVALTVQDKVTGALGQSLLLTV